MTKNEFMRKLAADPHWAPGWDAIEAEFARLYPGAAPQHFSTAVEARAALGGDQYLDGYSFYPSPKGYLHIVTFGLSELYGEKRAFGGQWSGKGCELTMKVREKAAEDALWACDLLSAIAKWVHGGHRRLTPYQILAGADLGISKATDTLVAAVLLISDTEAETLQTVYGTVQFLQVLALTKHQADRLLTGAGVRSVYEKEMKPLVGDGCFDWQNGAGETK